jgi:hypothetical protein
MFLMYLQNKFIIKNASILAYGVSIYEIATSGEDLLQPCFKKTLNEIVDACELFNIWYIKILVFKF